MDDDRARRPLSDSGAVWFVVSAVASVGGGWLVRQAFRDASGLTAAGIGPFLAGNASILLAGFAAWKVARAGAYSWLLPLAAINLLLLQPGRAGDVRTWRLEWGVMGLAWTLAAVLAFGLVASVVYSLFETRLPELRGQWVAVALLLSWWAGYLTTARRYGWRA